MRAAFGEPSAEPPVIHVDLSALPKPLRRPALESAAAQVQASLDLQDGPLLRFALFGLGPSGARLLLAIHHLVVDGVSWRILLEDLEAAWEQAAAGQPVQLPPKTISWKRWAERIAQAAGAARFRHELGWWLALPPGPPIPVDRPGGENVESSLATVDVSLAPEVTRALLQEAPGAYHARTEDLLLTALAQTLARWTGAPRLRLDLEGHGREEELILPGADLSRTVGWFTVLYPIVLDLADPHPPGPPLPSALPTHRERGEEAPPRILLGGGSPLPVVGSADGRGAGGEGPPRQALRRVKEQLRAVPSRGLGFGLLRYLGEPEDAEPLAALPPSEVVFNYLGRLDLVLEETGRLAPAAESPGPPRSPRARRRHLLEVVAEVRDGRLSAHFAYSENLHERETVETLAHGFAEELEALVAHCLSSEAGGWTPSDFPLARLDQSGLDRLLDNDRTVEDLYPLAPLQEGLLFHAVYSPAGEIYFEQLSCTLHGDLDADAFRLAWQRLVDRHGILRTAFVWQDLDEPLQVVRRGVEIPWTEEDWRGDADPDGRLEAFAAEDRRRGFDVSRAPLLRGALLRTGEDEHRFVWSFHHLLLDGWSLPRVFAEVFALYEAERRGEAADPLPPPALPYRDFVAWLASRDHEEAERWWRHELADLTASARLPWDRSLPPPERASDFGQEEVILAEDDTTRLETLARGLGLTLNTLVQGAWGFLLARWTGEREVVFGAVVAGRPPELPGVESALGLFVNTLPVRIEVDPNVRIAGWLSDLQSRQAGMRQHEQTPLPEIQRWSGLSAREPLFQTLLAFESYPVASLAAATSEDLEVTGVRIVERTGYPLTLSVLPGAQLRLQLTYDHRFEAVTARRLLGWLDHILAAFAADPERSLGEVDVLSEEERRQVLPAGWTEARDRMRTQAVPAVYETPRTQTERAIAAIWRDVLGVERVGLRDNFFDLGGHSLLLMRVHDRLRRELGSDLSLVDLFRHPDVSSLARRLRGETSERPTPVVTTAPRQASRDIAIIGMAGRFPGAANVDELWQNLRAGVESISFFTAEEMRAAGVPEELFRDPAYVPARGILDGADLFDAGLFDYSPREAELTDPQQRLFLECALEALENAGHDPGREGLRAGVWAGTGLSTYGIGNLFTNPDLPASARGLGLMVGNDKDFLATRAAYKLDLRGPAMTVQTACSTSLVAVHEACRSLLAGECEMALAGGVSVHFPQKAGYLYMETGIESPDGHCRSFDARAQGTVGGDGVGVVVLRPLAAALADGDFIHAVIRGSAINNDGAGKVGYTAPSIEGQARAIAEAQAAAGVDPATIQYVEAHGSATPLGDPIEVAALHQAFGPGAGPGTCALGSVKSNVGHLDAAAGITGLIKTVLALEHREIPPSLHFETPNPQIDFAAGPFRVNAALTSWPRNGSPRRAGVSSFGLGGTNVHVVLEEAPESETTDARPWQLLVLSARTEAALERATDRLARHLETHPDESLGNIGNIAWTLQAGRRGWEHRRALVCRSVRDATQALAERDPRRLLTGARGPEDRPATFVFSGLGDQYPGMGTGLYRDEPVFREELDRCAEILLPHLGRDLREVLLDEGTKTGSGPDLRRMLGRGESTTGELSRTAIAQPAVFALEYALAKLWMSWGVRPQAVLGYSLGEYVAACVSGVLSLDDALLLVAERARWIDELPAGSMLAVALPEAEVEPLLGEALSLAAVNGPALCVVAGPPEAIADLESQLAAHGIACRPVETSHAFHSRMMLPVAPRLTELVRQIERRPPRIPCLSNVTGGWLTAADATDPEYWSRHLCGPVRFAAGLTELWREPDRLLLEVGPGGSLTSLALQHLASLEGLAEGDRAAVRSLPSVHETGDERAFVLESLAKLWIAGVEIDWKGVHAGEQRKRVPLPAYAFERNRYWIERVDRVEPRPWVLTPWPPLPSPPHHPGEGEHRGGEVGEPQRGDGIKPGVSTPGSTPFFSSSPEGATAWDGGWVLFADTLGLATRIAHHLEHQAVLVIPGEAFARTGDRTWTIRPGSREDCAVLLDALGTPPSRILHLWGLATGEHASLFDRLERSEELGFRSVLPVLRELSSRNGSPTRLLVVADGLFAVRDDEETDPGKASLPGLCEAASKEGLLCRAIDLRPPSSDREAWAEAMAGRLLAEALHGEEPAIAWRSEERWMRRPAGRGAAPVVSTSPALEAGATRGPFAGHARPNLRNAYVPPEGDLERSIAGTWQALLGIEAVGRHDSFFEMGGHSLLATSLMSRVRESFGVALPIAALFENPTIAELAALVTRRRSEGDLGVSTGAALPVVVPDPKHRFEPFPLTDIQQAYWLGRSEAFELGGVGSHIYFEFDADGLDLGRLTQALRRAIDRHEMLRAVFLPDGRQRILPEVPPYEIAAVDLAGLDPVKKETALQEIRTGMSHQVLRPDRWPLFDIRAARVDAQRTRLYISLDVLIGDGWSFEILSRELARLYREPDAVLPPLTLSFRDYVLAEAALQETEDWQRSLDYWRQRVQDLPPAPELPLAKAPASLDKPRFRRWSGGLEAASWQRLKERGARAGLTPSGLLLAAFSEVLAAWSKSPRFTITLTLFNRLPVHPQADEILGDFTSLTLLGVDVSGAGGFETRARSVQERLWQDLEHRAVSGVRVLRELARVHGHHVLQPVVFTSTLNVTQGTAPAEDVEAVGPRMEWVYGVSQTPQVWLDHQVAETDGALTFNWDVVVELFPAGLIDAVWDAYGALLHRLVEDEATWTAERLHLLPAEQLAVRAQVNATAAPVSGEHLHILFARQAAAEPGRPAVLAPGRTLTYGELHRLSSRLGRHLRALGAQPNTLVAVVQEKGWEQVVSVLGVLAAGAAYLPLEPGLPRERLHQLLERGEVRIAVTTPAVDAALDWPPEVHRVVLDHEGTGLSADGAPLDPVQQVTDLAYVIFTSGSTGQPKGVMIDHRGAVNTVLDVNRAYGIGPDDRVLALSSLSFDLSVYDIFGTLAAGGAVVIPRADAQRDPAHWAERIWSERVTVWNSVPALLQMLIDFLETSSAEGSLESPLRLALLSGDWIPLDLPGRVRALSPQTRVVSLGGATEASIWSIWYPIGEVDPAWKSIPYGRPMANQTFHVLDSRFEPRPDGVPGQLWIGGIGLAQGYWRDPDKTAASFVSHPETGERLYRTGDLGRYFPDGTIEFQGREDFQVKVQGYRIELGEIEAALAEHPSVHAAVVVALGERLGSKHLVAYVVPDQDPENLRAFLRERLPDYMVPPLFVPLAALPLGPNGKVDRRALPAPEEALALCSREHRPPQTGTEQAIARIWSEVLGVPVEQIGLDDNFYELRGDSILATKIMVRVHDVLGVRLSLPTFFEAVTVQALAEAADRARTEDESETEELARLAAQLREASPEEVERMLAEELREASPEEVERMLAELRETSPEEVERMLAELRGS